MATKMKRGFRSEIKRRTKRGQSPRSIALSLGISTQAVYYNLDRLRAAGELPPKDGS